MGKVIVRGEEVRQQAIQILLNGGTWDDAAQATGFSRNYIRQLSAKAGIHVPKHMNECNVSKVIEMVLSEKYSVEQIRDICGYSSSMCVRQICKNNNIPYPKSQNRIRKDERNVKIISLRRKGFSQKEISEKLKVNIAIVASVCKSEGLGGPIGQQDSEFKICKGCGQVFVAKTDNQVFCSISCQRRKNHQVNDIKRKRLEKQQAVDDISLDDVYKKYNGICYLCGEKCDYNDVRYLNGVPHPLGNYPTREHIIPLSKGGLHTWTNVKLAHLRCNSSKGVKYG